MPAFVLTFAPFPLYVITRWLCAKATGHYYRVALLYFVALIVIELLTYVIIGTLQSVLTPGFWIITASKLCGIMAGGHFAARRAKGVTRHADHLEVRRVDPRSLIAHWCGQIVRIRQLEAVADALLNRAHDSHCILEIGAYDDAVLFQCDQPPRASFTGLKQGNQHQLRTRLHWITGLRCLSAYRPRHT